MKLSARAKPAATSAMTAFCGSNGFTNASSKIVHALEILDRILVGFSENAGADEIENHVPDVFAAIDSPAGKNRHHHRPEFLERVLPHAFEQLRPGHVANGRAFDFLLLLGRVIERVAQKDVSIAV